MTASRTRSKTDSVKTPAYILDMVKKEFGSVLMDPCPFNPEFDKSIHQDGVAHDFEWGAVSFVNPPYSNVKPWFRKAREQWKVGKTGGILCKLSNLGTQYAKLYTPGSENRVLTLKVKFDGYDNTALFSNVFVIFRAGSPSNQLTFI